MTTYMRLVEFLEPSYILIEQVMDIFKNNGGVYARTAAALLTEMRYQSRTGVLTAGFYGVAQVRGCFGSFVGARRVSGGGWLVVSPRCSSKRTTGHERYQ